MVVLAEGFHLKHNQKTVSPVFFLFFFFFFFFFVFIDFTTLTSSRMNAGLGDLKQMSTQPHTTHTHTWNTHVGHTRGTHTWNTHVEHTRGTHRHKETCFSTAKTPTFCPCVPALLLFHENLDLCIDISADRGSIEFHDFECLHDGALKRAIRRILKCEHPFWFIGLS